MKFRYLLLTFLSVLCACNGTDNENEEEHFQDTGKGVFILNEGNYNSGNSTLSYYYPGEKRVENGIFLRSNDRKLGDTGQSMTLYNNTLFIAMENSGIVWGIDAETFRVKGQLTAAQTEHMINPRFVHIVNEGKAYVSDLYSPYITIFNPTTFRPLGSIHTGQPSANGYSSTENMVQYGNHVFTNCWSYSNKILAIDTRTDEVTDSIVLGSWQPKSMIADARGKLWVLTDGGYHTGDESFGDNVPHLYRIDAATLEIEQGPGTGHRRSRSTDSRQSGQKRHLHCEQRHLPHGHNRRASARAPLHQRSNRQQRKTAQALCHRRQSAQRRDLCGRCRRLRPIRHRLPLFGTRRTH